MSEWKEYNLSAVGKLQRGKSKHRPRYAFHLYGGPYPFVQTGQIKAASKYITEYEQTYSEAGLAQSKLWSKGTLCITIAANIAEIAILSFDACFPDSVIGFIPDKQKCDLDFAFYTLKHFQKELQQMGDGSVQDNINLGTFEQIKFPFPPLPEQTQIASILSSLDDKIDLLHRQNKTLEQLAETLFRQWFVEEAVGDNIKLGEVVKTSSGGTPSRSKMEYYSNGTIKWVKSKELQGGYIFETEETVNDEAVKNSSAKLFPTNTILIAMYGATVGEYGILAEPATCNQAICALIPNENYPYTFLFILTKFNKENLINMAGGSAQQNISQELIQELEIPKSNERIKEFHREAEPLFKK